MFSQECGIPTVHGGVVCHQGVGQTPQIGYYEIRPTSGRYASYWNAFLFTFVNEELKLISSVLKGEINKV